MAFSVLTLTQLLKVAAINEHKDNGSGILAHSVAQNLSDFSSLLAIPVLHVDRAVN